MHQLRRSRNIVGLCLLLLCTLGAHDSSLAQEVITSDNVETEPAVETQPPLETEPLISAPSSNGALGLPSGQPIYSSSLDGPVPAFATSDNLNLGIPAGRRIHLSLGLGTGYDDNINSSGIDPSGSAFVNASLGLRYEFGSPRTQFLVQVGGAITDYFESGSPDYSGYLGLQLTHKLSPRMTFGANIYATYTSEPNFNLNLGINRRVGSYIYSTDQLTLSYLWTPRFSTLSSYTLGTFFQQGQNNQLTPGDLSNLGNSQDRIENTFGNQFRYLLLPTTTVLIEYRLRFITYQQNSAFDSVTNSLFAGFDHTFSPRLNVSLRGGAEYRSFQSSGDSLSPTFDATLNYILGRRSSLSLLANYSLQPADLPGSSDRTAFRTGINGRYNWTARISSTIGFIYEHDDYGSNNSGTGVAVAGPTFSEDTLNLALSARYAFRRYLGIYATYNFTDVISGQPMRGYTRNHISAGIDFTF
jgi:Putative beta-barrel porin 2